MAEMLTALAIYHVYEKEGDDYLEKTQHVVSLGPYPRHSGDSDQDVISDSTASFRKSVGLLREAWNETKGPRGDEGRWRR